MSTKWSAFASGTTITGSDVTVGLQSGLNVQWTMDQMKTWTSNAPTFAGSIQVGSAWVLSADGTGKWGVSAANGLLSWDTSKAIISAMSGCSLSFSTNSNTGSGDKMVIDTSGNVGIGNASPGAKLDVNGSIVSSSALVRTAPSTSKWVIFGDSFSDSLTGDYPANVIANLMLTGTVTNAVAGNKISDQVAVLNTLLINPAYLNSFNILSLLIGVNDFAQNTPIGTRTDPAGTANFAGYLKQFIQTAQAANPDIRIFLMTPPEANGAGVTYRAANSAGWTLRQLSVLISQIGSDYAIPVIDLYSLSEFNLYTIPTYTVDGLHPSTTGRAVIGKVVSEAFSSPVTFGKPIDTSTPVAFGSNISVEGYVTIATGVISWGLGAGNGILSWDTNKAIISGKSGCALSFSTNNNTGSGDKLIIDTSGNVGIANASPSTKLDVEGLFKVNGGVVKWGVGAANGILSWDTNKAIVSGMTGCSLSFSTNSGTGSGDKMVIDTSGNVGIGTATPSGIFDVNGSVIRLRTSATPATASSAGNQGDIQWDSSYVYVCVATNTWKRTAISTW